MIEKNTYSEVFEVLSYMNKEDVMKIPISILKNIEERRNKDYKSKIVKEDLFNFNNISSQTVKVLAWLDINYWMDDEKKKNLNKKAKLKDITIENNNYRINYYNKKNENKNCENNNNYMVVRKNSLYEKIINFIKNVF